LLNISEYPSWHSWCALTIKLTLFIFNNFSTTSYPNKNPAPLDETVNPLISYAGSDHIKSVKGPSWGISINLFNFSISYIVSILGDNPPWTQKIS